MPGAAVVTGASRGIGAACAAALARHGAPVVVNYHSSAAEAKAVVERIQHDGGRAVAVQADVTRADDVMRLKEVARSEVGDVAIVVANAARRNERRPFLELEWDDYQRQLDVTLRQFMLVGQAFLPGMIERGAGRLIALGSIQAAAPNLGSHAYATAKSALNGMIRAIAKEVGEHGVTVNQVVPGFTATDRIHHVSEAFREEYAARTPLRRLGTVDDVAAAVVYLAAEDAQYVTGASHVVDGGHSFA